MALENWDMIRSLCQKSCTWTRNLARCHASRRWLSVTTIETANLKSPASSHSSNGKNYEDSALRQIFDSQSFWNDFSRESRDSTKLSKGLFRNRYLTNLSGFQRFAQDMRGRCQKIVELVLSASTIDEYKELPRKLDLLSDSLCRVLDVADFVRATHPDVRIQQAASQSYALLWEYMNVLNTTPGLNAQLQKAVTNPEVASSWNEEEATVAHILLRDFSNSAIELPPEKRQRFVDLSNKMKELGSDFVSNMEPANPTLEIENSRLKGISPILLGQLVKRRKTVMIPTTGDTAYRALESVEDDQARQEIYIAGRRAPRTQIQTLEELLRTRVKIAQLSGYKNYAELSLSEKMAKSPEAVSLFLAALSADNASHVKHELEEIQKLKSRNGRDLVSPTGMTPWDVIYYRHQLMANLRNKSRKPDFISAYFSVGTVMQGLSRLFNRLYGVHFVPCETSPGETWTPDVRRLDVMHETEGHIAVLYCDLFARAGKAPNPAHFTLRCSRHISPLEWEGLSSPEEANEGMAISQRSQINEIYQLPTIALICDFPHPPNPQTPTLLTIREVQTLFHEMGHAIHSFIGRTSLQVVAGTRCPTDFAELPSVLMEYFASDSSVLALFARHWETDAPLPYEMVSEALEIQKRCQGLQTETQILFSLLDQAYHSSLPLTMRDGFDSTNVFFDIYDKYGSVREPRETTAQGFFGHLVEYGGNYYSYLFDRAIAGKVWREVFKGGKDGGAVDREAGERYKDEVLRWGGARSGWACVAGVLSDERLKDGGKEAMEEVGRWGVHD